MAQGEWRPSVIRGDLRRLRDVDPVDLGVHDPPSASWLERASAARVDAAVRGDGRLVVVVGPPLSGKSHTLARAARTLLGDHVLVRPDDPHTADLAALVARAAGPAVVWLDDAPPTLLDQITPALLEALPSGVRVFVTVTGTRIPRLPVAPGTRTLLDRATYARLGALRPRDGLDPLAGVRPALDEVRAALTEGMFMTPELAVLRAVVDATRIGWPGPLPVDALVRLARCEGRGFVDPTDALDPLRRRLIAGRPALSWTGRGDRARPRTHPLAVAVADGVDVAGSWDPPSSLVWELDDLDPERRHVVGRTVLAWGATAWASSLLRDVDPALVPPALALEIGRATEDADLGRQWFRRAADDESLARQVHMGLGHLEADYLRDPAAAEAHFRAVLDEPGARWWLAWLAEEQEDLAGARAWHRELLEHGDADERRDAADELARLADADGDVPDARHWYARAREQAATDGIAVARSTAWARMELRHGEYGRVRDVLDGPRGPTDDGEATEAGVLRAAAALLGGDPEEARRHLPQRVTTSVWTLDRTAELFAVLLRAEHTRPAAEALARDPLLPWFERGPVRCLVTAVVADQAGDHAEARARYREVIDDEESAPVVAGIARYGLARILPFPDAPEARRLHADLAADDRPELRELGRRLR